MKMKKIISILLVVCLCLTVFAFPAYAATSAKVDNIISEYTSKDGLWEYSKYNSGFSRGYMIKGYYGSETDITLPETIDGYSISSVCLASNDIIENLTIPACYIDFENWAFADCSNLKSVIFSREYKENELKEFAPVIFSNCENLESVILPNYIPYDDYVERNSYYLEDEMFYGCKSLKSIVFPDNMTEIGGECFRGCSSLTELVIPEGVTKVGVWLFRDCTSLRSITLPDSLKEWTYNSFDWLENCTLIAHDDNKCAKEIAEYYKAEYGEDYLTLITYSQGDPVPTINIEPETSTESTTASEVIKGDINNDGILDINDVSQLQEHIAGIKILDETNLDIDGNGKIDINDATLIQKIILKMI